MTPPTRKAKMTDPTGTAIPRAIRSTGAGIKGRRAGAAGEAATILPIGSGGGGYVGAGRRPPPRFLLLTSDYFGMSAGGVSVPALILAAKLSSSVLMSAGNPPGKLSMA